jgi:hypothetical protein
MDQKIPFSIYYYLIRKKFHLFPIKKKEQIKNQHIKIIFLILLILFSLFKFLKKWK